MAGRKAALVLAMITASVSAEIRFERQQITDAFWSEGVAIGDFNRDGKEDVCAGPFWYAGPDFVKRHAYRPATASFKVRDEDGTEREMEGFAGALSKVNAYADDFMNFAWDFNDDGWVDILAIGIPGSGAVWYENPKGEDKIWKGHNVFDVVDNESPMLEDVTGDGIPELICGTGGYIGYLTPDPSGPYKPWVFHRISPRGPWHKYTHGLGVGDVNGDGRLDLVLADGWWEQPERLEGDPVWQWHRFKFAEGGAQMFVYDVNGDGRNDILTCEDPHRYGLVWWEQTGKADPPFLRHVIVGETPSESVDGVVFTQMHAMTMLDLDGDGLLDLVTGKRFWAHGPDGDVKPNDPAVLYGFRLERGRGEGGARYRAHRIDDHSGVGMQIATFADGGLAIANKKGLFVFRKAPAAR